MKRLSQTLPRGAHVSFFTSRVRPSSRRKPRFPLRPGKTETVNLHLDRTTFEVLEPFEPGPGPEPQLIVVPDLAGLTKEEAAAKLRDVALGLGAVSSQPSPQAQIGRVLAQKPIAGSRVPRGATIDVVIGSVQTLVTVPDLVGSSLGPARGLIAQSNLVVGKIDPPGAPDSSIVTSQEPKSESQVASGSAVDLQVRVAGESPPDVSVPSVVQLSLSAARKAILEAKLIMGDIQPADATDESIVIEQSPPADTKLEAWQCRGPHHEVPSRRAKRLGSAIISRKTSPRAGQVEGRQDQSRERPRGKLCDKAVTCRRCEGGARHLGRPRSEGAE